VATVRVGDFEWDEAKAGANVAKHGVSFEEAMTVFLDDLAVPFADIAHPEWLVLIGESQLGRVLLVVFTERLPSGTLRLVACDEPPSASGEPMKKTDPSMRSLQEIPEVDFASMRRLRRGKYAAKARRSFAIALVDPEIYAEFGSSEAVNAALKALLDAAGAMRPRAPARGRRPPHKTRTA
jgi:uncharacterized protein